MFSKKEKTAIPKHIDQVLREVEAEMMEGKRKTVTDREIAEEVLRRIDAKKHPGVQ